tara:strand:- start:229 stop:645 length:417 start_codon:yes stop_codon:yes gene_type:complete
MATTIATMSLSSGDLLSNTLGFTTSTTLNKAGTATGVEHTTGLSRTKVNATAKGSSATTLYTADDFAAIPYMYIKNTNTTAGNKIFVYDDTTSGDPTWLQLDAGDWGFIPMHGDKTLRAYAPNGSDPIIEWMVIGTDQ